MGEWRRERGEEARGVEKMYSFIKTERISVCFQLLQQDVRAWELGIDRNLFLRVLKTGKAKTLGS